MTKSRERLHGNLKTTLILALFLLLNVLYLSGVGHWMSVNQTGESGRALLKIGFAVDLRFSPGHQAKWNVSYIMATREPASWWLNLLVPKTTCIILGSKQQAGDCFVMLYLRERCRSK
jgi:hypothetical protein